MSLSNLQRQILYKSDEVGALKVEAAQASLAKLNPHVIVEARPEKLAPGNACALLEGADLVLDGTDDFGVRFAVNDACHALGITLISGAVGRWDGQLATFKSGRKTGLPCYRCLVPEEPPAAEPCSAVGVVGALTGVIGSLMALEAIKELAEAGDSLAGKLLLFDGLSLQTRLVKLPRDPACAVCGGA